MNDEELHGKFGVTAEQLDAWADEYEGDDWSRMRFDEVIIGRPWHFELTFDEGKARRSGYDVTELYGCASQIAERFGSWHVPEGRPGPTTQCPAVLALVRQPWVMGNAASLVTYEGSGEPEDFLAVVRRMRPELVPGEEG